LGDKYLDLAEQCRTLAFNALTPDLHAAWLKLAEGWLMLATDVLKGRTPEAQFEAEARAKGTGQSDSTASH
jgi:hypothetical protein